MSITICLLLYVLAVAILGPPVLTRLTAGGIAPHLGVTAWAAAIGGAAISVVVAIVMLVVGLLRAWNQPGRWVIDCFADISDAVGGRAGVALQSAMLALSALAVAAFATVVWRTARSVRRMRARTHRYAREARMIGHTQTGVDAVVIDTPEPAAYCVAGRPHTIVISRGALAALDQRQLGAVLAHERAHLDGRHHLLLSLVRGLAAAMPGVRLFTDGATEIARLLEMCADDRAVKTYGPTALLGGLLALAGGSAAPSGSLGAAGADILARANRLATPPAPSTSARVGILLTAAAAVVLLGPVTMGLLYKAGMVMCGPMTTGM